MSPKVIAKSIKKLSRDVLEQLTKKLAVAKHSIIFDESTNSRTKKSVLIAFVR